MFNACEKSVQHMTAVSTDHDFPTQCTVRRGIPGAAFAILIFSGGMSIETRGRESSDQLFASV